MEENTLLLFTLSTYIRKYLALCIIQDTDFKCYASEFILIF